MTKEEILKDDWVANNYGDRARNWIDPAFLDGVEWMENQTEGQALLYAVEKTAERTKREMIEKAVRFIHDTIYNWSGGYDGKTWEQKRKEYIEMFKQAMEEDL